MRLLGPPVVVAGAAVFVGCGQSRARSCVAVPEGLSPLRYVVAAQTRTVSVGSSVYVAVVEPEK